MVNLRARASVAGSFVLVLVAGSAAGAGTASAPSPPPAAAAPSPDNPFLAPSPLFFEAPDFAHIRDQDYQPALEEGMRRQRAEAAAIAANPDPPTFENTIEAMERSGELLGRVSKVFFNLTQSNTNDTLQAVESEMAPKIAAHTDAINLDSRLFARVQSLYDRRDSLGLDAEARYLVERYYTGFVRAGALLDEAHKEKLRALNLEESRLTTSYGDKLLAETAASALVLDHRQELAGLSDAEVAAAAEAAKDRGLAGKWVLTLQNTTQQPALAALRDRSVRERLYRASIQRGSHGGANDTRELVQRLARLRAEKAALLGYPSYAAYVLADQMAGTPAKAEAMLTGLASAAAAKARAEATRIQAAIDADHGDFRLAPWDWTYYAEKVRKAEYDVDQSAAKPYFELDRVLRDGVFYAAQQLYGLTFVERKDLPVYQPDVRVFEVRDADGRPLALYYGDFFARPNKSGGAWEGSFVDQSTLLGQHPVVVTVNNFQKPAPGQPALLTFDNVRGLFHEFGHALHGMFAHVRYPTFAGTNVARDFGEVPSQFNEHWALEPSVLAHYARHYRTGEPMPAELGDKIRRSRGFNQGYATTEYMASALVDLAWYQLAADAAAPDVAAFEAKVLDRYGLALPEVPPRYRTPYFAHIWNGGYAAGYYAYLWSEVIDDDAYAWFREHGGLRRENGQRFRDQILAPGGSIEAGEMYRRFRGRDAVVGPLLEERGLTAPAPPSPGG